MNVSQARSEDVPGPLRGEGEALQVRCLTEVSAAGLIAGALGLSGVLWTALLVVI